MGATMAFTFSGSQRHLLAAYVRLYVTLRTLVEHTGNPPVCRMSLDVNVTPGVKCGFASPMPPRPQNHQFQLKTL